jgi:cytochrome c biogenesis protein CcmG, thiol:disulfide interchange protein DsbE
MKRRSRRWGVVAAAAGGVLVLLCAAVILAARLGPDAYHWMLQRSMPRVGALAPDFSLTSLEGEVMQLSRLQGKPVLLVFSESWCPDCRKEAPVLQSLHESHPEILIVMVDKEDSALAAKFASDFGMTFPVLLDSGGAINRQYQIYGIPTTYFIDAGGVIRGVVIEGATQEILGKKLPLIGVEP